MEFETWWLLAIPLFFGLGWFASRFDQRSSPARDRHLPDAYFKGLNFLLNEQSDKAIDAFVDVVRLDPDTIELHFALGNLFRRRGETDRAIRVHQNLIDRADINPGQREHALFQLGQDYLRAGLLDRAEDAFTRLEKSDYGPAALRFRLELAQMVRDWPAAIALAERLSRDAKEDRRRDIAQFHCELADMANTQTGDQRFEIIARHVEQAIAADPSHPRPRLLAGHAAMARGDAQSAIDAWNEIRQHAPRFLALIADGWLEAHRQVDRLDDGLAAMQAVHQEFASAETLRAIGQAIADRSGVAAACAWVEGQLAQAPSLQGLEFLLQLRADGKQEGDGQPLTLAHKLLGDHTRRVARYRCSHCGFKATRYYWQCPGCARWDTYAPRRSEEQAA